MILPLKKEKSQHLGAIEKKEVKQIAAPISGGGYFSLIDLIFAFIFGAGITTLFLAAADYSVRA